MRTPHPPARTAIGCMCGTSLDAVDAVLVRASGAGLSLGPVEVVAARSAPMPARAVFARLADGQGVSAGETAGAALELGETHAGLCRALIEDAGGTTPDLVCAHGQTVWHKPPVGWQALNPWPIARAIGCPVLFDLRGSDLAGGGQGAPLTPLADWVLFRDPHADRVLVNLGGFCNATWLPHGAGPDRVRACDVCACNQVLDAAARAGIGRAYDADGAAAARGRVDGGAATELRSLLDAQADGRRSLGSGDECRGWVARWGGRLDGPSLLATACDGVAGAIARGIGRLGRGEVLLAGGSANNRTLVRAIADAAGVTVRRTDDAGVPAPWREGACFAVLGLLAEDGVEIALPGVTGRAGPIPLSGAWIRPAQQAQRAPRPTGGTC